MAFIYRQQNTGLNVISGTVKSIAEDGKSMVVATQERSKDGVTDVEYTAETQIPYEQNEFKKGYQVTVFGYGRGKNKIMADGVLTGQSSYEDQDISLVTGFVSKASYNPELKEDGTPKTKRDGSAKKPHYDITVNVHEGDKWVNHVIQIYDGKVEPGKKTPIERAKAMFGKFDKETNRIKVSVVTTPGREATFPSTGKDGKEYQNHYSFHMGYKKIDIDYVDQKEKEKPSLDKAKQEPEKEAPVQNAPVIEAENTSAEGNGFENFAMEIDMDVFS